MKYPFEGPPRITPAGVASAAIFVVILSMFASTLVPTVETRPQPVRTASMGPGTPPPALGTSRRS